MINKKQILIPIKGKQVWVEVLDEVYDYIRSLEVINSAGAPGMTMHIRPEPTITQELDTEYFNSKKM